MRLASLLVLILVLAAAAYFGPGLLGPGGSAGPDIDIGSRGHVERLALEFADGAQPAARNVEVVAEFQPAKDGIGDWQVEAKAHSVERKRVRGQRFEGLWLIDAERGEFSFAIDPEHSDFNQVALQVYGRGDKKDVLVRVRGRGFSVVSKAQRFPGNAPQTVILDLGEVRQHTERIEEVRISFTAQNQLGEVGVNSLALLRKPVSSWLPEPQSPSMVDIEYDSRNSVGISTTADLSSRFEVPENCELRFAYGQPSALIRPGEELRLEFELRDGEDVVRQARLQIPEGGPWQEHMENLSELAGRELQASFRLRASGDAESVAAVGVPVLSVGGSEAPSILLITSDTHRGDYVGYARSGVEVQTPFLDSLAERGVVFLDCFATTNITNPSHISLMTATNPRDTGVVDNISPLADAAPTLAEALSDAGYLTYAAISARHLSFAQSGLGQGFDRMAAPTNPQRDSVDTIAILESWLEAAEGRPLFAWLHIFDAHTPYLPPPEDWQLYYDSEADPKDPDIELLEGWKVPGWIDGVRDPEYVKALYKGEVTYLDRQLQGFITGSRFESGPLMITSDHGESLTAHKIYFEHKGLFPNTLGVPMILTGPGVPAGVRVEHPVRQTDSARTLLDMVGVRGDEIPGLNLLEQIDESRVDARYAISSHGHDASIHVGDWYLVLHLLQPAARFYDLPKKRHQVQLFDLTADPRCLRDLAEVEPTRARRMRQLLIEWLGSAAASGWNEGSAVISAEESEALAGLGYADGGGGRSSSAWIDPECTCERCESYREEP